MWLIRYNYILYWTTNHKAIGSPWCELVWLYSNSKGNLSWKLRLKTQQRKSQIRWKNRQKGWEWNHITISQREREIKGVVV